MLILVLAVIPGARAQDEFSAWLGRLRQEALRKGISQQTVSEAFGNIQFIPKIIELDRKQPEKRLNFPQYRKNVITPARIEKGRALLRQHRGELQKVSDLYGVPPQYIVALWGIETSYGTNTGNYHVVAALATLAYDGRRSDYFRGELFNALQIIDKGHIRADDMKGSWAGAMGQNQFMPSSFFQFAADGNGDGRRDIWKSTQDVFASTANYLSKSGWREDERWGREVRLSQPIPKSLTGLEVKKSLGEWKNLGVTLPGGTALPVTGNIKASLVTPDGGPSFLVYDNFRVLMKWNRSVYFASSVGILADRIAE